jgi:hypothetical protein
MRLKSFLIRSPFLFVFLGPLLLAGCATVSTPPVDRGAPLAAASPEPTPAPTPEPTGWSLVAGGDVLPACWLDPYLAQSGQDYPYALLAPHFLTADIGLVNLECPLSDRGKPFRNKKYKFRGQPDAAGALRRAGITVVALANNHILDYGPDALQDTLEALDTTGVAHAGAGADVHQARQPAVLKVAGNRTVAVLSYSLTYPSEFWAGSRKPGTALARLGEVEADVRSATAWADAVVVCFHWGGELQTEPRPYQIQYGRAAIDAGARIVLGSHPHILQGVEWYRGGVIYYSLGNLAFGGGRSGRAVDSILAKIQVDASGASLSAWALALSVDNLATRFVPTPLAGPEADAVYQQVRRLSRAWGTRLEPDPSGWVRLLPPEPLAP